MGRGWTVTHRPCHAQLQQTPVKSCIGERGFQLPQQGSGQVHGHHAKGEIGDVGPAKELHQGKGGILPGTRSVMPLYHLGYLVDPLPLAPR